MGHGASTNTKKVKVEASDVAQSNDVVWNRSNSDGCIVETLNSSRTKADLLEQQVDEYRDLLQKAEENYGKVQRKADKFEKQLAETESAKLELMDRMEDLEDELKNLRSQLQSDSTQELTRVIQEKNQEIESLQANIEKLSRDIKIVKSKCKERLKSMKSKLVESKQEYSMQLYQMKEELRIMEEENKNLSENVTQSPDSVCFNDKSGNDYKEDEENSLGDPRNQLIVELSSQVSQQEILILELKEKLRIQDNLMESKLASTNLSGTRSFSAGDKGRTADVKGRSVFKSRDHHDPHERRKEQFDDCNSSKGKTSPSNSGLSRDSYVSHKSKPLDIENQKHTRGNNPSGSRVLTSHDDENLNLLVGDRKREVSRLFSCPDGNKWSGVDTSNDNINKDVSSRTDGSSKPILHSGASSPENPDKSSHRIKRQQMKSRKLSPLIRTNADDLPGSPMCLNGARDFDGISIESGILSLDSYAT